MHWYCDHLTLVESVALFFDRLESTVSLSAGADPSAPGRGLLPCPLMTFESPSMYASITSGASNALSAHASRALLVKATMERCVAWISPQLKMNPIHSMTVSTISRIFSNTQLKALPIISRVSSAHLYVSSPIVARKWYAPSANSMAHATTSPTRPLNQFHASCRELACTES